MWSLRHRGVDVTPQLTHCRLSFIIMQPDDFILKSKEARKEASSDDGDDVSEAGSVDEGRQGGGDKDPAEAGEGTRPMSLVAGDGTEAGWLIFQPAAPVM